MIFFIPMQVPEVTESAPTSGNASTCQPPKGGDGQAHRPDAFTYQKRGARAGCLLEGAHHWIVYPREGSEGEPRSQYKPPRRRKSRWGARTALLEGGCRLVGNRWAAGPRREASAWGEIAQLDYYEKPSLRSYCIKQFTALQKTISMQTNMSNMSSVAHPRCAGFASPGFHSVFSLERGR